MKVNECLKYLIQQRDAERKNAEEHEAKGDTYKGDLAAARGWAFGVAVKNLSDAIREDKSAEIQKTYEEVAKVMRRPTLCGKDHYKGVECTTSGCSWNI